MRGAAAQGASGIGGGGFGGRLEVSARTIVADARKALSDPELSDAKAVHEVRRAIKRWRALLRLLTHPIGGEAERMRIEARDLMRELSGARDAQSALDALADLGKVAAAAVPPLSARSLQNMQNRLIGIRDQAEQSDFTPALRDRLMHYLDAATLALDRWPLAKIEFDAVADRLTVTYRRARALIPDDWAGADPDHLHELRRRVVEHRHQIELIEPLWPRLGRLWADEAQRLRTRLGACQDLEMLGKFTGPHQPLAPWRARLAPLIAARRGQHLAAGERIAGRLFAEKPKAFRRRIGALWKVLSDEQMKPEAGT